jgi:hypothetical protein
LPEGSDAVNEFVQRHAKSVTGCLSGFDRVLFRGTYRLLAHVGGLRSCLWAWRVLLKDFAGWAESLTARVRAASERVMAGAGRPVVYLASPSASKEDLARSIAERDGVTAGPVCLLKAVEPCQTYELRRDRAERRLELVPRRRQCLHYYHYRIDPAVGLVHVRLQTWLPFTLRVCLNGREWLCRQLDAAGVGYVRRDNCLAGVADAAKAQALLDEQLRTDWPAWLNRAAAEAHPGLSAALLLEGRPLEPYWSSEQTEWATDVMFKGRGALAAVYPNLLRHGITGLSCGDVMRFLGRKTPAHGGVNGHFAGEASGDLRARPEGVRLRHRVGANSVKMYDKQGTVLRVETTVNDPGGFKAFRGTEAEPHKKAWRTLRKGVADLHRLAEVSEACNGRYLAAMASVARPRTLGESLAPACKPLTRAGRRYRGLRPGHEPDMALIRAAADGRWSVNGFRNADVRAELFGADGRDARENRRRAGRVTRGLALLRAHGLVRRVPKTRRWLITGKGRELAALLAAAEHASAEKLIAAAA